MKEIYSTYDTPSKNEDSDDSNLSTTVSSNSQSFEAVDVDKTNMIDHPKHYGGDDNPHEPIKVIEHYNLNFNLGNVIKYVLRDKWDNLEDLKKAQWYLNREIEKKVHKIKCTCS